MFSIKADFDAADRMLSDIGRKQLPFATAMALNDTGAEVKEAEEQSIDRTFDRPTPFTKRGLYLRRASKGNLMARVGVKRVQADYLRTQVEGGTRTPKGGGALVVPAGVRLNKYGNIPRGALARLKARGDVFVASRRSGKAKHLAPGVYRRQRGRSGGLKMEIAFEGAASYSARWNFHDIAMRKAKGAFRPAFVARFRQAMATAR